MAAQTQDVIETELTSSPISTSLDEQVPILILGKPLMKTSNVASLVPMLLETCSLLYLSNLEARE